MIVIASRIPAVEKILTQVFGKYADKTEFCLMDSPQAQRATTAACWFPDIAQLQKLPQLKLLHSIAAGVEHLNLAQLVTKYQVCRVLDPQHQKGMLDYILWGVLYFQRQFDAYIAQAQQQKWQQLRQYARHEICIGVMGLGHMGAYVAEHLASLGYQVRGWSKSTKHLTGVTCYADQEQLPEFLSACQILINLLPLTPQTQGMFDAALWQHLPQGAGFIHCGRGQHLIEADVLHAVDNGQLRGAILDVFTEEPLAAQHPYWQHPQIIVTPHIASHAPMSAVVSQIIANQHRLQQGLPLLNQVDLNRGY